MILHRTKQTQPAPLTREPQRNAPEARRWTGKTPAFAAGMIAVAGVLTAVVPGCETPPPPQTYTNDLGMEFVLIPSGSFEMGSNTYFAEEDEQPVHGVAIEQPFYLGTYEVTQGQWKAVMETEPWQGEKSVQEGDEYPAVNVSWNDVDAFIEALNTRDRKNRYRLPTEAEWEYACRAGSVIKDGIGDDADDLGDLGDYEWYWANTGYVGAHYAHQVGRKKPNAWGVHDMQGNVSEWTQSLYRPYPYDPQDGREDLDVSDDSARVERGGSFYGGFQEVHCASRYGWFPFTRGVGIGFRVVMLCRRCGG